MLSKAALDLALQGAKQVGNTGIEICGEPTRLESEDSLKFLADLVDQTLPALEKILSQREKDRLFIDQRVCATTNLNVQLGRKRGDRFYYSVFGQRDADDRVVFGPNRDDPESYTQAQGAQVAPLPDFLLGEHVTLFGLADSSKSCDEAAECGLQKLANEPAVVEELLNSSNLFPKWGVDAEDSQTPLRETVSRADLNLADHLTNSETLSGDKKKPLTLAIKRLPGLAIPSTFSFKNKSPIPLHIYEFALHLFAHWNNPRALVFYFPKIENEEEAEYLAKLIRAGESLIQASHPEYKTGTVRVIVVIENARAVFRVNEIMDALFPFFAGASLGWHDFIASTARLFKEDPTYRMPLKSDSTIVIKHIRASHELLANVVGKRGGIAIGGMYGTLPSGSSNPSAGTFQVTLRGFFKDVVTQLKRGLAGFWVARADFVRIGMAVTIAWNCFRDTGDKSPLEDLVNGFIVDPNMQRDVLAFVFTPQAPSDGVTPSELVVADLKGSHSALSDSEEIRYNVFQTLQYITDWLCGNGCVALPSNIDGYPVLVMDDLATVERSRWQVWHEIRHERFSIEELVKIAHEEMNFIRRDLSTEKKIVQVKWNERTSKWYPVALEILLKLMTDKTAPADFVTSLLLPFTVEKVRQLEAPLEFLETAEKNSCPPGLRQFSRYTLDSYVKRFHYFFERCGVISFARAMAACTATDLELMRRSIFSFDFQDVVDAASFHGNIGQSAASLDKMASAEQAKVFQEAENVRTELRRLGEEYLSRFGVKFLVSAKGKTGSEMLEILRCRMSNTLEEELQNARAALHEITLKRVSEHPLDTLMDEIAQLRLKHNVAGASLCISSRQGTKQTVCVGNRVSSNKNHSQPVTDKTLFEIASLSKTIGSAFAIEYFAARGVTLDASVNRLLEQSGSTFRLSHPKFGDAVELRHLMSHSALNMHYVNGVPLNEEMPNVQDFITGNERYGYPPVEVLGQPGTFFKYSGGGFLVLEHLIESFEKKPIAAVTRPFLDALGISSELTFEHKPSTLDFEVAHGYDDEGNEIPGTRKMFPSFAAGALGTPQAVLKFLEHLAEAYRNPSGSGPVSHDTAVLMLQGTDKGCKEFMGCQMGIGVFVGEAGPNRFTIHQGANDGFRGVYLHCFDGPDKGDGLVMFANGDNRAMFFIAEVMQRVLLALGPEGIDMSRFGEKSIDTNSIKQEEIVNYGYKALVFDAFQPTLPDEIVDKGPIDPLAPYNAMVGAHLIKVSNQRFARATNLTSPNLPKFDPELFCPMGKVMDSWETARHNELGEDEVLFQLRAPAKVAFVSFSTKYHYGNQAAFVRLEARVAHSSPEEWAGLVPKMHMDGHAELRLKLELPENLARAEFDQVRVVMFPDGGLSRVSLFDHSLPASEQSLFLPFDQAKCVKCSDPIPATKKPLQLLYEPSDEEVRENIRHLRVGDLVDASSLALGGSLVSVTNQHYGPAGQVLSPYIPLSMHDGFESARSRAVNHHEELVFKLGIPCRLQRIELDFHFFVNNNPKEVQVFGKSDGESEDWIELVPRTQVKAFAGNVKVLIIQSPRIISHVRLMAFPDGGVNRFRAFGVIEASRLSPL